MDGVLVFFHCASNTGYAIGRLEPVLYEAALEVTGNPGHVHFAYPDLSAGLSTTLPSSFTRVIAFDSRSADTRQLAFIEDYVREHRISMAVGFDQPVRLPGYAALRRGGVHAFISYWGAPMSSINSGVKLLAKRLDVRMARHGPDHYIFESNAMRETAVRGRGIPAGKTSITHLSVDTERFRPAAIPNWNAHDRFGIPRSRSIVYYSGHMEPRKGVAVLIRAAAEIVNERGATDVHFLLLGNRNGEERTFLPLYSGTPAERHITFGGYQADVEALIPGCSLGAICSTGWDSFTMSSLEIAACGIPLLVSRLPGLDETVVEGETGYMFPVGSHEALAERLMELIADKALRERLGHAARARVLSQFTRTRQVESIADTIRSVGVRNSATRGASGRHE